MKRRICSYDETEVPADSYTLTEEEGDIYLCNPRSPLPQGGAKGDAIRPGRSTPGPCAGNDHARG